MRGEFTPQFPGKVDRAKRGYVVQVAYRGEGPLDGTEFFEIVPLNYGVEIGAGIVASGAVVSSLQRSIRERISKYNRGLHKLRLEETLENTMEGLKARAILANLDYPKESARRELIKAE